MSTAQKGQDNGFQPLPTCDSLVKKCANSVSLISYFNNLEINGKQWKDSIFWSRNLLFSPLCSQSSLDQRLLIVWGFSGHILTARLSNQLSRSERVCRRLLGQLLLRRGGGVAQLRGPGGDAESGLHHRLLLAQCHHPATRYPDGQVWSAPNSPGGQVMVVKQVTFAGNVRVCRV